jgi:hypothetical protein
VGSVTAPSVPCCQNTRTPGAGTERSGLLPHQDLAHELLCQRCHAAQRNAQKPVHCCLCLAGGTCCHRCTAPQRPSSKRSGETIAAQHRRTWQRRCCRRGVRRASWCSRSTGVSSLTARVSVLPVPCTSGRGWSTGPETQRQRRTGALSQQQFTRHGCAVRSAAIPCSCAPSSSAAASSVQQTTSGSQQRQQGSSAAAGQHATAETDATVSCSHAVRSISSEIHRVRSEYSRIWSTAFYAERIDAPRRHRLP